MYSYGVLLFELIAGRNPQQGLMEYVELVRASLCLSFGLRTLTSVSADYNAIYDRLQSMLMEELDGRKLQILS